MDLTPGGIFAAIGGAQLVAKVLGPTADHLGNNLLELVKQQQQNNRAIIQNAGKKLGPKLDAPGGVPMRVLREVFSEGAFIDTDIAAEYFGGILAGSKTTNEGDDRGLPLAKLVSRLSSFQLRAHYVFYEALRYCYKGQDINFVSAPDHGKVKTYIPHETFVQAMQLKETGDPDRLIKIVSHALYGLYQEGLIGGGFRSGTPEHIGCPDKKSGIIFLPSVLGAELFLWAHGKSETWVADFMLTEYEPYSELAVDISLEGCEPIS